MALDRQGDRQRDLLVTWQEMPRSPGHAFYDRLQQVLVDAGFDAFAETTCRAYFAAKMGAPSIPPGRYFRMHMVGSFEGIDSERALVRVSGPMPRVPIYGRLFTPAHGRLATVTRCLRARRLLPVKAASLVATHA